MPYFCWLGYHDWDFAPLLLSTALSALQNVLTRYLALSFVYEVVSTAQCLVNFGLLSLTSVFDKKLSQSRKKTLIWSKMETNTLRNNVFNQLTSTHCDRPDCKFVGNVKYDNFLHNVRIHRRCILCEQDHESKKV